MKKTLLAASLLLTISFTAFAVDKNNLIEKSEKLFDCSEVVDQKMMEQFETIKNNFNSNPTLLKLVEKEEKKQKLNKKDEQELMNLKLQFYKANQELSILFFNNSLDCVKQSFPKFPDLELNKE